MMPTAWFSTLCPAVSAAELRKLLISSWKGLRLSGTSDNEACDAHVRWFYWPLPEKSHTTLQYGLL